jgi:hypothetical protein
MKATTTVKERKNVKRIPCVSWDADYQTIMSESLLCSSMCGRLKVLRSTSYVVTERAR